jgi:Winged helix DNA-binding domain
VAALSWAEVCARRLGRHGLAVPFADAGPAEVVRAICGAHAQVMSAAELSLGLRIAGLTRGDVHRALWEEHSLVKTRGPRGTVHLLPARDLAMWAGALAAIPPGRGGGWPEEARLSSAQTDEIVAAIGDSLADAELTTDELTEALAVRLGAWAGEAIEGGFQTTWPRWRQAEWTATVRGAMCFGPPRGRKVTYTNPRRLVPDFRPEKGLAALAVLVKRYLHAYGPATPAHFARWLGAPRGWATELFGSLGDELEQVEPDGAPAWVAAGDAAVPAEPPQGVRLLPYFDAYTVGCHPRELLFPGRASERALARGQAGNFPVLLVDGIVAGVWHQRRSGRKLAVTVEPFRRLTASQRRALDEQVDRVGQLLEGTPSLTVGTVTAGPHA